MLMMNAGMKFRFHADIKGTFVNVIVRLSILLSNMHNHYMQSFLFRAGYIVSNGYKKPEVLRIV